MSNLGNNIKKLREKARFTQEQFAEAININRVTLSRYESGSVVPGAKVLARIADTLHVNTDTLLDDGSTSNISDIDFALYGEIRELTDDEKQDILDYMRFKRAQKAKQ